MSIGLISSFHLLCCSHGCFYTDCHLPRTVDWSMCDRILRRFAQHVLPPGCADHSMHSIHRMLEFICISPATMMVPMLAMICQHKHAPARACKALHLISMPSLEASTIMMSCLFYKLIILSRNCTCATVMCNNICTFMSTYLSNKNCKCFYSTQLQCILSAYNVCHPCYC